MHFKLSKETWIIEITHEIFGLAMRLVNVYWNGAHLSKTWMIFYMGDVERCVMLWVNFITHTHEFKITTIYSTFIGYLSRNYLESFIFFFFVLFKFAGGELKMFKGKREKKQIAWLHLNQIVCKNVFFFSSLIWNLHSNYRLYSILINDFILNSIGIFQHFMCLTGFFSLISNFKRLYFFSSHLLSFPID